MKASIVISVYNSHQVLDRQIKHFGRFIPDDVELIIADDGSSPPLRGEMRNLHFFPTNNKLAWTQGLGRNLGASRAQGEYLLMTDIDHIISEEALTAVRTFKGAMMRFRRTFGILDKGGNLKTDKESLREYGLAEKHLEKEAMNINTHRNTFAIKKEIFDELGGYKDRWCKWGYHPKTKQGDDCYFDRNWRSYARKKGLKIKMGPAIYVFPNGRFHKDGDLNPFGLFHNLTHEQIITYKP